MKRRNLLGTLAASVALAGCSGDGGDGATPTDPPATTEPPSAEAATPTDPPDTATPSPTPSPTPAPTTQAPGTVAISGLAFEPRIVSVPVGTTVTWRNDDGVPHDVTARKFHEGAKSWDIETRVPSGEQITHTFDAAGVYDYVCTIHGAESMCGTVVVGDTSATGDAPCE